MEKIEHNKAFIKAELKKQPCIELLYELFQFFLLNFFKRQAQRKLKQ